MISGACNGEAFAEFEPSKVPSLPAAATSPLEICSLSVSTASEGYQAQIYVGTVGGTVVLFALVASSDGTPKAWNGASSDVEGRQSAGSDAPSAGRVEFVRSTSVGRSPVEVVHVLPEVGRLIVLSDGFLFLLDLLLLQPARKLGFIKGTTALSRKLVCTESASSDPLGDVALKSKLLRPGQKFLQKLGGGNRTNGVRSRVLGVQREGETSCFVAVSAGRRFVLMELILIDGIGRDATEYGGISVVLKEIHGVDGVGTMAWLDDSIIVGTVDGYLLISTATGQSTPLFSLREFSGPPRMKTLCRSKQALLLVDNVGGVVNSFGQPVGGSLIFWQISDSITEILPYALVSGDGWMDLCQKSTEICVQSASLPRINGGPCIVASDDWGNQEVVVLATQSKVIFFHIVSAEEQIKDFLRKKYFNESILLVEDLETEETMQPSEIFPFIMQDPNRWSMLEELEAMLEDSGHSRTLVAFLYASKGMSSKAPTIWRRLARNYSTGLWRDPATSQRVAALESSKLLEESSDQGLVLQHLGWVYCR